MANKNKFSTRCVHEGEIKDTMYQGIVSPLFMSTTYPWFGGDSEKKPYPRYFNTPNQEFLSKKIASLENGETALIFTSGMAAISTSIMANVKTVIILFFKMIYMEVQEISFKLNLINLESNTRSLEV